MAVSEFVTETGVAVPAVTVDQMREIDRLATEEIGPSIVQMMENAGRSLAMAAIEMIGGGSTVVVLAGTGGNGGGGICAARHLANRGLDVSLVITRPERLGPVPAQQLSVFRGTNGRVVPADYLAVAEPSLVIDAVIGYSLDSPPRGPAAQLIDWTAEAGVTVLALDVPSGVDAGTGETLGAYVQADRTVTLALPKTGLDAAAVGDLWLADIGIPAEVYRRGGLDVPSDLFGPAFSVKIRQVAGR